MAPLLAMPEGGEWVVLLIIVVLLFGAKKLPELTRSAVQWVLEQGRLPASDAEA